MKFLLVGFASAAEFVVLSETTPDPGVVRCVDRAHTWGWWCFRSPIMLHRTAAELIAHRAWSMSAFLTFSAEASKDVIPVQRMEEEVWCCILIPSVCATG